MEFIYGATTINYRIEERKEKGNSFIVGDVLGSLKKYDKAAVIYDVYTEVASRGKGYAKAAIEKLIEVLSPSMPVLADSGVLQKYFPAEPTNEEYDKTLKWQHEFLEKVGFTCINEYVGYEFSEAFLYVNDDTKLFIEECVEFSLKTKKIIEIDVNADPFVLAVKGILCGKLQKMDLCDLLLFRDLYAYWDQSIERSTDDFKAVICDKKLTVATNDGNSISCKLNSVDDARSVFQPWLDVFIECRQKELNEKIDEASGIVNKAVCDEEE